MLPHIDDITRKKQETINAKTQVMALLRPLLLDNVASIQQSAALALGRLANYSDELAESVVTHEILPQLVYLSRSFCAA